MRPLTRLLGALSCLFAATCSRPPRVVKEIEPHQPRLTVMTYNVNFGLAGDPDGINAIREGNADIVFLQETNEGWEEAIRRALGAEYPYISFRHCCRAGGLAVLSKFPFEEKEYIPAPSGWFPAWRLLLDTPLGKIQALNIHLHPPVSDKGSVVSGYFSTPRIRLEEITEFAAVLEPGLPTLVVGDFNENKNGKAIAYLQEKGFRSALPEFDDRTTWRWKTSLGEITHQLDHIVYSPELTPLRAHVIEAGGSDHFPVVALFQRAD